MGKSAEEPSSSKAAARISQQLYKDTKPLRQDWLSELGGVMSGSYDPTQSPMFAPIYSNARTGIEDQYGVAKENILSFMPRGGAQGTALANTEMERAKTLGAVPGMISKDLVSDMINKSYGAAWQTPQMSLSGLGTAAYGQGMAMQAQAAENAAKYESIGSLFGNMMGDTATIAGSGK